MILFITFLLLFVCLDSLWRLLNICVYTHIYTLQQGGQMASLHYGKRINNEGPHESIDRPSKMMRVDDRRTTPFHTGHASNTMLPNPLQLQEKAPQVPPVHIIWKLN